MTTKRPNILCIMTDQHSPRVSGCYGDPIVRTPHIDRLAGEGMRFDGAHCASPWCVPSRASFMTCRTPTSNRVWCNDHILSSAVPTWAHVVGAAGYETALLGRMHFVGPDQHHGFESRPVGEFMARHPGTRVLGGPMWQAFPNASVQERLAVEVAGHGHTHYQWGDEHVTDVAEQWLLDRAGHTDRPFAAVVGYMLPHCPFISLKEMFEYYHDKVDVPAVENDQPPAVTRFRRTRGILDPPLDPSRIRNARAAYYGLVEHADRMIGRLLDTLDRTGLAENTLVVYCSDHGEMAGEHGCWWKSTYYESSVRVPMIARLPGVIEAGSTCGAVCNLMDLGVSFAEIADGTFDRKPDGRSLWQTMCGRHPADWQDVTFSEMADTRLGDISPSPSRMIRSGPWKLSVHIDADELPPTLFNLDDDPDELHDLGQDPACAQVRQQLMGALFDGWDPQWIRAESIRRIADARTIAAWGRVAQPAHPDALRMPGPEYESDVVIL